MSAANVLVVAGRKLMREGLTRLLTGQSEINVRGDAEDPATAVRMILPMRIRVVVLILSNNVHNGAELVRSFTSVHPQLGIIVLPMQCSQTLVQSLLQAGAKGCLTRDCDSREIVAAIRTVVDGCTYLSPALAEMSRATVGPAQPVAADGLAATPRRRGSTAMTQSPIGILASREREVLQRIASGQTTKEIAYHFGLSTKTIETHRARLMKKLDRYSVAELTQYAIAEGLISLPPASSKDISPSQA